MVLLWVHLYYTGKNWWCYNTTRTISFVSYIGKDDIFLSLWDGIALSSINLGILTEFAGRLARTRNGISKWMVRNLFHPMIKEKLSILHISMFLGPMKCKVVLKYHETNILRVLMYLYTYSTFEL